jgi:hypothetical protein
MTSSALPLWRFIPTENRKLPSVPLTPTLHDVRSTAVNTASSGATCDWFDPMPACRRKPRPWNRRTWPPAETLTIPLEADASPANLCGRLADEATGLNHAADGSSMRATYAVPLETAVRADRGAVVIPDHQVGRRRRDQRLLRPRVGARHAERREQGCPRGFVPFRIDPALPFRAPPMARCLLRFALGWKRRR